MEGDNEKLSAMELHLRLRTMQGSVLIQRDKDHPSSSYIETEIQSHPQRSSRNCHM